MTPSSLTPSQRAALAHVTRYAATRKAEALETIAHVCKMGAIAPAAYEAAVTAVKAHARVALHFHPDRPDAELATVAASLLACGVYKSQFETLLSNGSVSAFPGGERDRWEERLFGGAYQLEGATVAERPKYGALDLMLHGDGPSPRFGSCFFVLRPEVTARCTFTYMDSHADPKEKGALAELDDVLAALLAESFSREFALGTPGMRPPALVRHLATRLAEPYALAADRAPARNLDHYVEAQVHGDVRLDRDVEMLVADPSFRGKAAGASLEAMARRFGFGLRWHAGFRLAVDAVPDDFRGPTMPSLARRLAIGNYVDPSMIGPAAFDLKQRPEAWAERGASQDVLQELKLLWHVLVRHGLAG